ncbi:hypothetical protein TZ03_24215 [Pseudomonas sp. 10-1B]|uniref:hypothetical protein n=1 Tax=Pseudomonas sp. 10-1B TaxID=1546029 RepID=UPI00061E19F3|nr:hypothetical protein [Pseudomonas sp. 10-1B]KIY38156.1 hypothetical protein TZ03_24215 [Pseudomonas sp. 10-1B]
MNQLTSYDLGKMLAVEQIAHYQHLKQAAVAIVDKVEYRRCTNQIDILIAQYGLKLNRDGDYE